MTKGASTAILTVMIVMLTVSMVMLGYSWLSASSSQLQSDVQNNTQTANKGCIRVENIDTNNNRITLRNCGGSDLNNIVVFVDSEPVANYSSIDSGGIVQISYSIPSGEHSIFVSSDTVRSSEITFVR